VEKKREEKSAKKTETVRSAFSSSLVIVDASEGGLLPSPPPLLSRLKRSLSVPSLSFFYLSISLPSLISRWIQLLRHGIGHRHIALFFSTGAGRAAAPKWPTSSWLHCSRDNSNNLLTNNRRRVRFKNIVSFLLLQWAFAHLAKSTEYRKGHCPKVCLPWHPTEGGMESANGPLHPQRRYLCDTLGPVKRRFFCCLPLELNPTRFLCVQTGPRVLFLCFWSLLQLLIFYFSFEIYNRTTRLSQARATLGITLGIARGAAAVINFDCGLILFSVCRNLISLLRSTFLNDIVPFDKNIMFHKTVAWSIVFFSIVHSVGHYVNYYRLEIQQRQQELFSQSIQKDSLDGNKVSSPDNILVTVQAFRDAGGTIPRTAQAMAVLTGPGITGHILVLILFLMVTSSVGKFPLRYSICEHVGHLYLRGRKPFSFRARQEKEL